MKDKERALKYAIFLTLLFFFVEVAGGLISGSLSLLGDALHMLRDVVSLLISFAAVKVSRKLPTPTRTFGYHRVEILAALLNGLMLVGISIWIFYEALERIRSPKNVIGSVMLWVALSGLVVNIIAALMLHGSRDLNVKSAFLHVLTDTLSSVAVIIAAIFIWITGKTIIDPILAFLISLFILVSSFGIIKEALRILLEFSPRGIDSRKVAGEILQVNGVEGVHHLHIWNLCSNIIAAEAHILTREKDWRKIEEIKRKIKALLREKFKISHTTLEFEWEECGENFCEEEE